MDCKKLADIRVAERARKIAKVEQKSGKPFDEMPFEDRLRLLHEVEVEEGLVK